MNELDQLSLLDKLLTRARVAPEAPDLRFALFLSAQDLAVKLGKLDQALRILEYRSRWFESDELIDKSTLLRNSAQNAEELPRTSIEAAVAVVEQADKQARPDIVDELMRQQKLFAQPADAPELSARIVAAKKRWEEGAKERESLNKLLATLESTPDDKEANLLFGKHLCFRLGDWSRGLPLLQKSGDAVLAALARKDLANPMDGKSLEELSYAWFNFYEKAEVMLKAGALARARYWMEKVPGSDLPNPGKLGVASKLLEVNNKEKLLPPEARFQVGDPVFRANFNTLRTPIALETQWALGKGTEATKDSIVVKADGTFRSRFKPQEKWTLAFVLIPDGREIKISVCGEEISLKPLAVSSATSLVLERKGNKLSYRLDGAGGEKPIDLAGPKLTPTLVSFKAVGPGEKEGMVIKSITVTGLVKLSE
jgi:hypothetical protein